MPSQFYVRKSTAFFKTLHPYERDEFNHKATTRYYKTYPMDLRDLQERDPDGWKRVNHYTRVAKGMRHWDCRASAAETQIPNFYVICKCGITPTFSGGLRIEQNQINMGAAVVAGL